MRLCEIPGGTSSSSKVGALLKSTCENYDPRRRWVQRSMDKETETEEPKMSMVVKYY